MTEKQKAREQACVAERARWAAAAGASSESSAESPAPVSVPGEPAPESRLLTIPEAIATLSDLAGTIAELQREFAQQADRVLKALEGLSGTAIPTEVLIAMGIKEEPAPVPSSDKVPAAPPASTEEPAPESD